jgi:hypothetical protein
MTPKQQREEISKAYVHAVAARCGYKVGTWSQDAGCIDVSIAASGILGLWVSHTAEQLVLRRCAWWRRMTGDPALPPENTDAFVTVHLPPSQHFSPDALQQMMTRVGLGEMP